MGIKARTHSDRGFTVIEVMLFLAVTGALAVGILVGAGVSIGQQRYRDSVNSLKSTIQDRYNQTTNVVNSRGGAWVCDSSPTVTENPAGSG
jgi:type II secretory pathway pseudopilin PulG